MNTNKLSPTLFNATNNNLTKLAALFPSAVKDGQLDIIALKEELGQFDEVSAEKYELTWAGKQTAKKIAQEGIAGRTLKYVPQDSKNADTTENLYIEGDNLEVLKLLRQNYYGAIKMIYIDPPYNTGNDFVYHDNFSISRAESDEAEGVISNGERLIANQKSSNRFHANWLNMMLPRLRVAKDLLGNDGVIFISIDDNEANNLRALCNEIFGEDNFIAALAIENNPKGRKNGKYFSINHETCLVYAKSTAHCEKFNDIIPKEKMLKDDKGYYSPGQRVLVGQCTNKVSNDIKSDKYYFVYYKENQPLELRKQLDDSLTSYKLYQSKNANGQTLENTYTMDKLLTLYNGNDLIFNEHTIYEKDRNVNKQQKTLINTSSVYDLKTESAGFVSGDFDLKQFFTMPKNINFIKMLMKLCTSGDDIVLDFFSGSASTAHAVTLLNSEDGGSRRFIMVQLPEVTDENSEAYKAGYKNICEIGKERMRRTDIGFKVFRTADTNIRWAHLALTSEELNIDENMLDDKDKLDFMPHYTDIDVAYEILLRQRDIPLSAKVEKLNLGTRTYIFANVYVVCLDEKITADLVEQLAAIEPTPIKYIFRDSAFDDNISLKDETIRRLEAYIARNNGENKKTYTVEFI